MKRIVFGLLAIFVLSQVFSLNVVATLNPYYLIVKEMVPSNVNVNLLIKPGSDPHTFNPTVSDVKVLSKADLIIANGLELDNSYLKKYKNVLYVGEKIPVKYLSESDDHDEGMYNPHVWLSIDFLVTYIIPSIRDELIRLDKTNSKLYTQNAQKIIRKLTELSKKFDELLKGKEKSVVILEHPSYLYLFRKYGIEIMSLEEGHGKEPSAKHIKSIIDKARKNNLIGIFVGPQFKAESIKVVAKELKREYKTLDPLGYNAKSIAELFENAYKSIREATYGK
ncbi:metal ABC transporter substrate-binding protein [Fervidobacterium sp.]